MKPLDHDTSTKDAEMDSHKREGYNRLYSYCLFVLGFITCCYCCWFRV